MTSSQKTITTVIAILLGLIIILAVFIAWQKNKLKTISFTKSFQPEQVEEIKETETITQEKKVELTPNQQIVKDLAPESDLSEFNVSDVYLTEKIIANKSISPAFNRAGSILELLPSTNQFVFLNDSLDKEKEYLVTVNDNTNILINTIEDIYQNEEAEDPVQTKNQSFNGDFSDLRVSDNVNIRAVEMIGGAGFVAENIRVKRVIYTYLE